MSEYQYYEFRALERPLSKPEQAELRRCSSRASITSNRFVNEYQWGDFRGEPEAWMKRYFDAHLYFANWGSSSLMLRLPLSALDKSLLQEFVGPSPSSAGSGFEDALEVIATPEHIILAWRFNDDSGYCDRFCDEEGAEWLNRLLPLRDELLGGDTRPLYLGWLARVCAGELGDADVEPPLPAGLASLTAAQQALVAGLEGLLDGDADAGDLRARLLDKLREAERRLAVGEEVIDDQDVLAGWQELLQHEDVGVLLLRVGEDAVRVDGLVDQGRLLLAREDERHVERKRRHDADGDARCLDRQDAVNARIAEEARELLAHRLRELRIDLVIQE